MASPKPSRAAPKAEHRFEWEATYDRLTDDLRLHREHLAAQHAHFLASRRRLELSDEEALEVFDVLPVPTFLLDANGGVCRINAAATELLGMSRLRVGSAPLFVFMRDSDRRGFLEHMRRCREARGPVGTELTFRTRGGFDVPVHLSSRGIGGRSGADRVFLTTALDLRERVRSELDRQRAIAGRERSEEERERISLANDAKDRFLAMLSHELRAPLTPILLATSTWKDHASVPEPVRHALAMIHRNANVEARLIDDLLDLTRIAQNKLHLDLQPVDLHAVIDEVVDSLNTEAAAAMVTLALALEARVGVLADPLRVRQVVSNLVRNAIRFTPPGGRVTIATKNGLRGFTKLIVSDTGIGFDEATRAHMFEPFDQGPRFDKGGLGLGLAITKGLVAAQGGAVEAFSDGVGRGARIVVELPATDARPERPPASAAAPDAVAHGPLNILLVEDHEDTGLALSYVLRSEGYHVTFAHNVAEALSATATADIDVVVSDLGLPDGSGLDVIRVIKARKPVRSIALTGYGRHTDIVDTHEAGFDRHLTKPIDVSTLIATIESLRQTAA